MEKKTKNIEVIHKPNGGVNSARNIGLLLAKGEYISFVDADDYVELNYIRSILNEIDDHPETDLFVFGYKTTCAGKIALRHVDLLMENLDCFLNSVVLQKSNVPWNKVFKRDIIKKHSLRFCSSTKTSEDGKFYRIMLNMLNVSEQLMNRSIFIE